MDGKLGQEEITDRIEVDDAFARPNPDPVLRSRRAPKDGSSDPRVKIEDDEEQPRGATDHSTNQAESVPAMSMGERKRKADMDIGAGNCRSKRLAANKSRSRYANQQTSSVTPKVPLHSFAEPPPDANRGPTPAAHIYRNETGVFVRPRTGWQFRELQGTTKVWYDGKWRPLIQDQPSFKGVRESKDGWIIPMMAGPKMASWASLQQRTRWELQGRVEFNSPF